MEAADHENIKVMVRGIKGGSKDRRRGGGKCKVAEDFTLHNGKSEKLPKTGESRNICYHVNLMVSNR